MVSIEEQNGNSVTLEQAQEMLSEFSAVNLDEVSPATVSVAFREFVPSANVGYSVKTITKEINTWVPMYLFNRMLANQKKVQQLRKKQLLKAELTASHPHAEKQAKEEDEEFDLLEESTLDFTTLTDEAFREVLTNSEPAIIWQAREVLTVWKLTPGEEQMSLKRLLLGLTFEQIQGLFMRFFGAMIRRRQSRA